LLQGNNWEFNFGLKPTNGGAYLIRSINATAI